MKDIDTSDFIIFLTKKYNAKKWKKMGMRAYLYSNRITLTWLNGWQYRAQIIGDGKRYEVIVAPKAKELHTFFWHERRSYRKQTTKPKIIIIRYVEEPK